MVLSAKGRRIVRAIRAECKAAGVRLFLRSTDTVLSGGNECSGFFDAANRRIVICSKTTEARFFAVLFHEVEHMKQWRDAEDNRRTSRAKVWNSDMIYPDIIARYRSAGDRYPAYLTTLASERGAELASTDLLRRYDIGTPAERVGIMNEALLYLFSHQLMWERNRWYKEGETILALSLKPEVVALLPKGIRGTDLTKIDPRLRKYLRKLF